MKILCNCSGTESRDPALIKHNGKYYWTCSVNDRIYVKESMDVAGFEHSEAKLVWTPDEERYAHELWAPELHVIDGVCYIYVACDDGDNRNHRMYVLSNGSNDPLEPYRMIGKITDSTDKWAIDGTIFRHETGMYFLWSGWEGDENIAQNIYIAKMKSPTEISSERVMISHPEHAWEKLGGTGTTDGLPFINEGPYAFREGGRTFVAYSAAGSWCTDYCIALLELVGDDPLDATAWKKQSSPIISKNGYFMGMGHCSVIEEDKLVFFHGWSTDEKDVVWHTVHPIYATYRLDGETFIIE